MYLWTACQVAAHLLTALVVFGVIQGQKWQCDHKDCVYTSISNWVFKKNTTNTKQSALKSILIYSWTACQVSVHFLTFLFVFGAVQGQNDNADTKTEIEHQIRTE